jgi:hypothetical protein
MVTIVWNPTGFYLTVALPKGMKSNVDYYISHAVDPLAEWRGSQVRAGIQDRMSTRTMLALTLRRRLLNSSQVMAWKEAPTRRIHNTWHFATFIFWIH